MERSRGCLRPFRLRRMRRETSTGWFPWTPRSPALISTRPAPVKRGRPCRNGTRSRPRTIPWRTDDQDSPRLRRPRPSARLCRHRRQRQRLHAVRAGPCADQGSPPRPRPTAQPARSSPGRQGIQQSRHTQLPAETRYLAHHPGTLGPAGEPPPSWQQRRQTARFRQGALQTAQRRRALLQRVKAVPGHSHPLRQNPRILRSSTHHRVTPDVDMTL